MIGIFLKKYAWLAILIFGGGYLIGLPIFNQFSSVDWNWQGMPLDAPNYYYARLREILDGNPFMGNPYFWEHRNELSPAFFLADWLAVIPMLFGLSLGAGSIFNLIIWTTAYLGLGYIFLRQLTLTKMWSAMGACLLVIVVYSYLIIPVSMQVIYPVFLLFLMATWRWLKAPDNRQAQGVLIGAATLNFYIYTYLWQVAVVFLGLFLLYFLYSKQWSQAKKLFVSGIMVLVLSGPLFVYTGKQLSHPFYWDTMERIGLVYTHLPTGVVFYSGQWVLGMLVLWYGAQRLIPLLKKSVPYQQAAIFFGLLGLALVLTGISNVFMGKELETAQHIDRFTKVWFVSALMTWLFFVTPQINFLKSLPRFKQMLFVMVASVIIIGGSKHYFAGEWQFLVPQPKTKEYAQTYQSVIEALQWLENAEKEPVVVWSNSPVVDSALSISTKHYVLFTNYGILHLLSSVEVEDRYLTSKYFNQLTVADLQNKFREYAGSARSLHEAFTHNRAVRLCKMLKLEVIGVKNKGCGTILTPIEYRGEDYFLDLLQNYQKLDAQKMREKLKQYHVRYLVKYRGGDQRFNPESLPGTRLVHTNDQLAIYVFE